jgi:hypothetical protein
LEWNTPTSRVMFPSTTSSNTTSARDRPAWGRAVSRPASRLSILAASAGRFTSAGSATRNPVSGATGPVAGSVVVTTSVVVVAAGRVVVEATVSSPSPPARAKATAPAITTTAAIAAAMTLGFGFGRGGSASGTRSRLAGATGAAVDAAGCHRPVSRASELPEGLDALLDGWVGVEEAVPLRQAPLLLHPGHRRLDPEVGGGPSTLACTTVVSSRSFSSAEISPGG